MLRAKAFVSSLVVMGKIETVFDEWSTGVSVVADPIPANPRIE
jgi:hypothetical protein